MKLSAYLKSKEITDTAFAEQIGVSRQALWRYKTEDRRPEWQVMEKILAASDGLVTPNDFISERALSLSEEARP